MTSETGPFFSGPAQECCEVMTTWLYHVLKIAFHSSLTNLSALISFQLPFLLYSFGLRLGGIKALFRDERPTAIYSQHLGQP